jgi:hypothetical protein
MRMRTIGDSKDLEVRREKEVGVAMVVVVV